MLQGIIDSKILKKVIKDTGNIANVKAMCIWGAFTDEVPGIHLGHVHMINRLRDLAKKGIQINICINEAPFLNPNNKDQQSLIKQHADTTVSMLHVMSDLKISGGSLNVYLGGKETEQLRRHSIKNFTKIQCSLEKARCKIVDKFTPLKNKGPSISNEDINKYKPKICKSLRIEENAFDELLKLFVVHNKAHAHTQWASDFGATVHLMKDRPSFLLVGERHGYIWALYDCMFRLAGLKPIPIVRVENFMDCVGKAPMNSRDPENCISLDDSEDIMREKFLKGVHLAKTNEKFALRDVFEKLIFACGYSISINKQECKNYQEIIAVASDQMALIVDTAINFLKEHHYLSLGPILSGLMMAKTPHRRSKFTVDNFNILNYIAGDLSIVDNRPITYVNEAPQDYRSIYDQVMEKVILGSLLDPLTIDVSLSKDRVILTAFEKVKELIRFTRDMDILPYQIAKRHRDHYYHQINVGGLGAMLLDVYSSDGVPLWKYMADKLDLKGGNEIAKRKVKAIWWITALLHDHAYALEHAFTFLPNLLVLKQYVAADPEAVEEAFNAHQKLLRPMMTNDIASKVFEPLYKNNNQDARKGLETLVGEWIARIPGLKPSGVEEKNIREVADNHGVMGAINLLSHVSAAKLKDEWQQAFEAIAAAILVHHLPAKPNISFSERPLSFLLAFVDEIQEWSRLQVYKGKHKACLGKIELGSFLNRPEQPNTMYFDDHLDVVFFFGNENILREIDWDRERFHKDKARGLNRLVLPGRDLKSGFPHSIIWREVYISTSRPG